LKQTLKHRNLPRRHYYDVFFIRYRRGIGKSNHKPVPPAYYFRDLTLGSPGGLMWRERFGPNTLARARFRAISKPKRRRRVE
jgi:hypothetical protein